MPSQDLVQKLENVKHDIGEMIDSLQDLPPVAPPHVALPADVARPILASPNLESPDVASSDMVPPNGEEVVPQLQQFPSHLFEPERSQDVAAKKIVKLVFDCNRSSATKELYDVLQHLGRGEVAATLLRLEKALKRQDTDNPVLQTFAMVEKEKHRTRLIEELGRSDLSWDVSANVLRVDLPTGVITYGSTDVDPVRQGHVLAFAQDLINSRLQSELGPWFALQVRDLLSKTS